MNVLQTEQMTFMKIKLSSFGMQHFYISLSMVDNVKENLMLEDLRVTLTFQDNAGHNKMYKNIF